MRLFFKLYHSVIEKTEVTSPQVGFTSRWNKSAPQLSGLTRTHSMPASRQPSRTCHFSLFPAISASTSAEGIPNPEVSTGYILPTGHRHVVSPIFLLEILSFTLFSWHGWLFQLWKENTVPEWYCQNSTWWILEKFHQWQQTICFYMVYKSIRTQKVLKQTTYFFISPQKSQ